MSDEISLNCWIIDDLPPDDRAFSVGYEHRPPEGLHQGQEQAYLPTRTLTPDLSFSRVSIPRGQCVIGTCQKSRRGQGFVQLQPLQAVSEVWSDSPLRGALHVVVHFPGTRVNIGTEGECGWLVGLTVP